MTEKELNKLTKQVALMVQIDEKLKEVMETYKFYSKKDLRVQINEAMWPYLKAQSKKLTGLKI